MITTTDTPLLARNTHTGPTVFCYGRDQENHIEWAGAGDAHGADVQVIPASLMNNPAFRKNNLATGIIVIENDDDIDNVESAQRDAWEERQREQREASAATIDEAPDNDFIVLPCIGLSKRGSYKQCGADVSVRAKERFEKPPLCTEHKGQEKDFVPRGTGRVVGNQSEMVWEKVRLADRVVRQKNEEQE